jgi:biopolymer transport protein ExbB/TolQ
MILDMIVFIAFALVMLLLIAFFYFRDKSVFAKLSAYERAIDDLNSRLYELEIREESEEKEGVLHQDFTKDLEAVEARLDEKLHELGEPLLRTIRAIKTMESNFNALEQRINARIAKIEDSTKLSTMSNNSTNVNEQRIIEMFKNGKSIEKIAKKERVSQGEVELILRIANLR